jgi:activating signal cointegrator 1
MKALTMTQPWATLVAIGAKRIETRSWSTPYRGPLAIHAAKGWSRDDTLMCWEPEFAAALMNAGIRTPGDLPLGSVVATCRLVACVGTGSINPSKELTREFAFGDFSPGRYAWLLADIVALPDPIPARGQLGLWEFDDTVIEQARARRG